jgi:hypothetical protein
VKVQTRAEVPGADPARRKFSGTLRGLVAGAAVPTVRLEDGELLLEIPVSAISKAHLVPRFS